jgi:D-glycero-D-manno-heptose 1,7-bisphosphate phosphatase
LQKMANNAVLLDRDDTLIEDPGYINHPSQVRLIDGVAESLIELRNMGYKLAVVSNQSGVARGIVTEQVLGEIHDRLKTLLAEKGAHLDAIYYCPYHPEGIIPKYRRESDLRKPSPGMILQAAKEMDLDLSQSWAIGNSDRDIEAGRRAGCKTIMLETLGRNKNPVPSLAKPDYRAVNLKEAVNIIKKYHRTIEAPLPPQPQPPATTVEEPQPQAETEQAEQNPAPPAENIEQEPTEGSRTEQLLAAILDQLKRRHREELFGEFSWLRFLAGVFQGIVPLGLLVSIVLFMRAKQDSALMALGFTMVFQLMTLTFYIMQERK